MLRCKSSVLCSSCCTAPLLINLANQLKRHGRACVTVCVSCINVYLVLHKNESKLDLIWQSHCYATFWVERPRAKPRATWAHKQNHWGRISKESVCRRSIRFLQGAQHALMNKRQGLEYPAFMEDTLLLRLYKMFRSERHLTRVPRGKLILQHAAFLDRDMSARSPSDVVVFILTTTSLWLDGEMWWTRLCFHLFVCVCFHVNPHVTLSVSIEVQ